MKLTLPLPPNIANARMHWRVKLKAKKAYWQACSNAVLLGGVKMSAPPTPPERARITATMYVHQYMDADNAMARLKFTTDWLVGNGYIADDSRKHLEYAGLPEQVIDRKRPRVEIEVTALRERGVPVT